MPTDKKRQRRAFAPLGNWKMLNQPVLEIRDGQILHTGQPAEEYLREWQKTNGFDDGTLIYVITANRLQSLVSDANLAGIS